MREHLGMRVLVTVGDNDQVRQTAVRQISPNERYVFLNGDSFFDESIGWVHVSAVQVVDVIGDQNEPLSMSISRCYERN